MKTAQFQVPASLDQTLPTPGDATYQTEQLALILNNTIKELDDEGFEFSSAESSDFSTYGNSLKTFIDNMHEREEDILTTGATTVVANLPDVLPIIGAILSGGTAAIPSILLNAVISQLFRSRDTAIEVKGGEILPSDVDLTDLVDAVEGIQNTHDVIEEHVSEILRSFKIPANGDTAYFIDEFRKFALDADFEESKLSELLTTFTINLISQFGTQGMTWGPNPDEP